MQLTQPVTLFALDCGATNWRLVRGVYKRDGERWILLGDPQPAPLTSFSDRKLPAALTLSSDGKELVCFGEIAQNQLEDENLRERVREYFKPCIGAHLDPSPLSHQTRYSHSQALFYTGLMLGAVLEQIQREKLREANIGEDVHFSFAYPVHWRSLYQGQILKEFKTLVYPFFPESFENNLHFVAEPEAAILSMNHQGLLTRDQYNGTTMIVDIGGSSCDIIAGQPDFLTQELFILGRYGESFGGGHYDDVLSVHLSKELGIPDHILNEYPSTLINLRFIARQLKETLSRSILQHMNLNDSINRMVTIVLPQGEIYRKMIKLDQKLFEQITRQLNNHFADLLITSLQKMSLQPTAISQVALVGGGAQLFSIVNFLREFFGPEKVLLADNPEEIVVRGTALQFGAALGVLETGASILIRPPVQENIHSETETAAEWQLFSEEYGLFVIHKGNNLIGRGKGMDIWLNSERISRKHAQINLQNDELKITDFGSTNGTFLNGEKILQLDPPGVLKIGDEIRFGDRSFIVKKDFPQ